MAKRMYYWITVSDDDGKPYLVYGGLTEEEARQNGMEMLGGLDFQLRRFPTRDLGAARAYLAGRRLDAGKGLRESARRQGHEKSIVRLRKRMGRG